MRILVLFAQIQNIAPQVHSRLCESDKITTWLKFIIMSQWQAHNTAGQSELLRLTHITYPSFSLFNVVTVMFIPVISVYIFYFLNKNVNVENHLYVVICVDLYFE